MKKYVLFPLLFILIIGSCLFFWLGSEINDGIKTKADGSNDYAIILGAKVNAGGVPSLSLKYRLDAAIPYLNKHPNVTVIVSGGQGKTGNMTEAFAMQQYLVNAGISTERIILEEASTSTYENLAFSKELLPGNLSNLTIISNDFHLKRASFLANKLGLKVDTVAASTPKVVEMKLRLRERAALLKTYLVGQ